MSRKKQTTIMTQQNQKNEPKIKQKKLKDRPKD